MNFKQLEYAISVAENKSFSKAAAELYISQPSLSHSIHSLEEEIGFQLFDRMSRATNLTYEGLKFIEVAKMIISIWGDYLTNIQTQSGELNGRLTIGMSPARASTVLPAVLPVYMHNYPNVEVVIEEDLAFRLEQRILENRVDLGIFNGPILSDQINALKLKDESLVLVTSLEDNLDEFSVIDEKHRWPTVSLKNTLNKRFVSVTQQQRLYGKQMDLFEKANVVPEIIFCCQDLNTLLNLVAKGVGYAILIESSVILQNASYRTKVYSIEESADPWPLLIAHHKNKKISGAVAAFIKTAHEVLNQPEKQIPKI